MKFVWITRADHWWLESRETAPITKAEWLSYLKTDREFEKVKRVYGFFSPTFKVSWSDAKHLWEWTGHSQYRPGREEEILATTNEQEFWQALGYQAHFGLQKYGISIGSPDEETLGKTKRVANALHANVIGDDDKRY